MAFHYGIIPCAYSTLKDIIYFVFNLKSETLSTKILTLTISTIILIAFSVFILIPYLLIVNLLKTFVYLKHKKNFGSFLEYDTWLERLKLFEIFLYVIEHEGSYEEVERNVKIAAKNLFDSHYKFSSTIERCLGLCFYKKNQVNFNDIITTTDEEFTTKEDFINYIENYVFINSTIKTKLLEVKIFKKPIKWNGLNNCYAIIIRNNHSLGDGVQLSSFLNTYFLSEVDQEKFKNVVCKSKRNENVLDNVNICNLLLNSLKMNGDYLISNKENNHLAMFEENDKKYLKLIPKLSRKLQCRFTDVILCASAMSILDYLKSKNIFLSEFIMGNTTREFYEDKIALSNGKALGNNVSFDFYDFLNILQFDYKLKPWLNVLNGYKKTGNFQLMYILLRFDTYLPGVVVKIMSFITKKFLVGVTNIPGPNTAKIGSLNVKNCYTFPNGFMQIKFVMTIFSFGGKLQACLTSHKGVDINRKDLQQILENTFKNIDQLLMVNGIQEEED